MHHYQLTVKHKRPHTNLYVSVAKAEQTVPRGIVGTLASGEFSGCEFNSLPNPLISSHSIASYHDVLNPEVRSNHSNMVIKKIIK